MRRFILPLAAALALAALPFAGPLADEHVHTQTVTAGELEITPGWARAMLPNQPAGGGYLTVTNTGSEPDRLLGASSPTSGKVEIHAIEIVDDVMTMRPVESGLPIPAGATIELEPGGLHLMFMQVAEPFAEGGTVPVTLEFEKAGPVGVELPVRRQGGAEEGHSHSAD